VYTIQSNIGDVKIDVNNIKGNINTIKTDYALTSKMDNSILAIETSVNDVKSNYKTK